MKIVTGYWGNYIQQKTERLQLFRAVISQISRIYPQSTIDIWYPLRDQGLLWNSLNDIPNTSYCSLSKEFEEPKVYDQIRYSVAKYYPEGYLWIDPDCLLFRSLEKLDDFDLYGYRREDYSKLYPNRNDKVIRDYEQEICAEYRHRAGNLGIYKVTAELGYVISEENKKLVNRYLPEQESILHCWISQGMPMMIAEKYRKRIGYLEDYSTETAWHFCRDDLYISENIAVHRPGDNTDESEMWNRVLSHLDEFDDVHSVEEFKKLIVNNRCE